MPLLQITCMLCKWQLARNLALMLVGLCCWWVLCRYSMFNSPLPNMRQATTFYHTELRCVIIQVGPAGRSWQYASARQGPQR